MKFIKESHKHGDFILSQEKYVTQYHEIEEVISSISDSDIISRHREKYPQTMSLSHAINDLLRERFIGKGWMKEAPIFQDKDYQGQKWRLDFAKDAVSVEVAFNHGEAIAWNLLKPALASEQNNVLKAIETEVGVIISATKELKEAGAFDSAVGEFEKFCRYLRPLSTILRGPLLIIGLSAPESFKVVKKKVDGGHVGEIVML
ncbi:MAG: hypothetical protein KBC33_00405 [Candidatus Pacebacteria bacterium]|nr:hypothetical protein [Candidatus Paceibacterota bacterium]